MLALLAALAMVSPTITDVQPAEILSPFESRCGGPDATFWGADLCGRVLIIDRDNGRLVANAADSSGRLELGQDGFWSGPIDDEADALRANTAALWSGDLWAVVQHVPARSREASLILALHESFHRIQSDLPVEVSGGVETAGHLQEPEARVLLRLQLAALGAALVAANEDEVRLHFLHAAEFARRRVAGSAEAADAENGLERLEGLAEYAAWRAAFRGEAASRFADHLANTAIDDGAARTFPYLTGPAWGLVMDRLGIEWRAAFEGEAAGFLAVALAAAPGRASETPLESLGAPYGYESILHEETARAAAIAERRAEYIERFIDGPTIQLPLGYMTFDPRTAFDLAPHGDVYGVIEVSGPWGRLVTQDGALLHWGMGRVVVDRISEPAGDRVSSDRWAIEIQPGWEWAEESGALVLREVD